MDHPKCRTCGERHRLGPCPSPKPAKTSPELDKALRILLPDGYKPEPPKSAKKTRAPNGTFDRKAYQRDLMRKRRAEEKAKKGD